MPISPLSVLTSIWRTCKHTEVGEQHITHSKTSLLVLRQQIKSCPTLRQVSMSIIPMAEGRTHESVVGCAWLIYVGGKCWEHWPWLWWDFGRLRRSWTWSSLHPELQPVDVCNRSCVIFFREYWNVLQLYCDCTCHHAACLASSDVLVMYSTTRTSLSTLQAGASIASFEKASLIKTPPDSTPDRSFNELNWVDTFWILAAGGQWQHGPNHGRTLSSSITRVFKGFCSTESLSLESYHSTAQRFGSTVFFGLFYPK